MLQLLKDNKILIGGVLAAALFGWVYLTYYSGSDDVLLETAETVDSTVSQELLLTLGNLRTIRLDETLFADPVFVSLSDFRVVIPPEISGRRNPFAPIGSVSAAPTPAATTSAATSSAATTSAAQ